MPVTEQKAREIKDDLVSRLADSERSQGAVPSATSAEVKAAEVINSVDQKIAQWEKRRAEKERENLLKETPEPEFKVVGEGEYVGEPGHSPKVPESVCGEKVTCFMGKQVTNTTLDELKKKHTLKGLSRPEMVLRTWCRLLLNSPLRQEYLDIVFGPMAITDNRRVDQFKALCDRYTLLFGNPFKPRGPKIISTMKAK